MQWNLQAFRRPARNLARLGSAQASRRAGSGGLGGQDVTSVVRATDLNQT